MQREKSLLHRNLIPTLDKGIVFGYNKDKQTFRSRYFYTVCMGSHRGGAVYWTDTDGTP